MKKKKKRVKKFIERRKAHLRTAKEAQAKIFHRVWQGVKEIPAKELSAFILQNLAAGAIKELKKK